MLSMGIGTNIGFNSWYTYVYRYYGRKDTLFQCCVNSLGVGERDAIKLLGPVRTAKVGLCLQASDGICLISLPQHDGECLVVLPATRQVDVGVQEITDSVTGGRNGMLDRE